MNYKEIYTGGVLNAFVKYFWRYEHTGSDLSEIMISILNQQPKIDIRKLKLFDLIYSEEF